MDVGITVYYADLCLEIKGEDNTHVIMIPGDLLSPRSYMQSTSVTIVTRQSAYSIYKLHVFLEEDL